MNLKRHEGTCTGTLTAPPPKPLHFDVVVCTIGQFFGLDADIVVLFTDQTPILTTIDPSKVDDPDEFGPCPNELYLGLSRAVHMAVLVSPPGVHQWLLDRQQERPPLDFEAPNPSRPSKKMRTDKK